MFITLFLLAFALSLCFIPERQAYLVRTWAFVATILPRSILFIVVFLVYSFLFCDNTLAEPLEFNEYYARYCKPENHGIDLSNPLPKKWVHWSDWKHLITPESLQYIECLGKADCDLFVPGCPIAAGIWGLVMTDGSILKTRPSYKNHFFRLHLQNTVPSAAYLAVTACFLEHVGLGHGMIRTNMDKGKANLVTTSYQEERWNGVRAAVYVNNVKVVPNNVHEYISPFGLTMAIMGDGRRRDNALSICIQDFSFKEVEQVGYALKTLYNVKTNIHGTKYPDLYIHTDSMHIVRQLVKPYLHSSWSYKLYA